MTVFQSVLGQDFAALPQRLQDIHSLKHANWRGQANVQTGGNLMAKISAIMAGLHVKPGQHPLTVTFKQEGNGEVWERNFGGQKFRSHFTIGTGQNNGYAIERFGVISVALALVRDDGKLRFIPKRCKVFGVPLPNIFLPKGESYETEKDGKFHFNVAIKLPLIGLIAAYEGWLEPEKETAELEDVA